MNIGSKPRFAGCEGSAPGSGKRVRRTRESPVECVTSS